MNFKNKKVLYGTAAAAALALGLNALLGAREGGRPPLKVPRPAEAGIAGTLGVAATTPSVELVRPSPEDPGETPAAAAPPTSAAEAASNPPAADELLRRLEAFAPTRREPSELDGLARPRARGRARPGAASGAEAGSEPVDAGARERELNEQFEAWSRAHPLNGLVVGASGATAMFAGRIVRIGDELVPGCARVVAIDATGVDVECGRQRLRLQLPPFEPRAAEPSRAAAAAAPPSPTANGASPAPAAAADKAPTAEAKSDE